MTPSGQKKRLAAMTNEDKTRIALRALLKRLIRQAASELLREGMRCIAAAERMKRWRA